MVAPSYISKVHIYSDITVMGRNNHVLNLIIISMRKRTQTCFSYRKLFAQINPSLHAKRWTFIKTGLDDFRDGFPPMIDDYTLSMKQSINAPLIKHDDNVTFPQRLSTIDSKKRLTNKEVSSFISEKHLLCVVNQKLFSH